MAFISKLLVFKLKWWAVFQCTALCVQALKRHQDSRIFLIVLSVPESDMIFFFFVAFFSIHSAATGMFLCEIQTLLQFLIELLHLALDRFLTSVFTAGLWWKKTREEKKRERSACRTCPLTERLNATSNVHASARAHTHTQVCAAH